MRKRNRRIFEVIRPENITKLIDTQVQHQESQKKLSLIKTSPKY